MGINLRYTIANLARKKKIKRARGHKPQAPSLDTGSWIM